MDKQSPETFIRGHKLNNAKVGTHTQAIDFLLT